METIPNPTSAARETLRVLAQRRIAPTPENYRRIYIEIAGAAGIGANDAADEKLRAASLALPASIGVRPALRGLLERALKHKDWASAREALLALTEICNHAKPAASTRTPGNDTPATDIGSALRTFFTEWEADHAGWTRAQKRRSLERALTSGIAEPAVLVTRLQRLASQWRDTGPQGEKSRNAEEAVDPKLAVAEGDGALLPELRECLAATLDVAIPRLLQHAPDLVWEARALASRARQVSNAVTSLRFKTDLQEFTDRLKAAGASDSKLQEALLKLLRMLVDNIHDMLSADQWVQNQIAIVRQVLAQPLTRDVIDEAESALKDLMAKQSAFKESVIAARDTLKALMSSFLERLAELSTSTDNYHEKLETYSKRIETADDIGSLNEMLQELLHDTRTMQVTTDRTRRELAAARERVEQAELRIREMEREVEKLSERAREDMLTGTLNRRGLDEAFTREAGRADRGRTRICVALLDLDNFKQLNDQCGHPAGDAALVHIVEVIKSGMRQVDVVARYGGEEFVLLLPDTDAVGAADVMTRLQRDLTRRFFLHNNNRLLITFSCGIALRKPGEPLDIVLDRADQALYQAKKTGKNRVMVAEADTLDAGSEAEIAAS